MKKLRFLAVLMSVLVTVESKCSKGCDLALASHYITQDDTLDVISSYFHTTTDDVMGYNPIIKNRNNIITDTRINVPFSCDCIDGDFLGHVFSNQIQEGETYTSIAESNYANLTTPSWIDKFNDCNATNLPIDGNISVMINCSCGNSSVSTDYGLFITYPLISDDTLSSIAEQMNVSASLLQKYNPGVDFGAGTGLVYIPGKDKHGSYRPFDSGLSPNGSTDSSTNSSSGSSTSSGSSSGVIVGVCAAVGLIALLCCWYFGCIRRKKRKYAFSSSQPGIPTQAGQPGRKAVIPGITVDKSVEFSYAELSNATKNFSLAHKIGQGGFGAVYYGELRGEKTAIKKMDMQATKEFLAELKVLSHVHHLNLVRLIGYCVDQSLFLVYEYIENGTLSEQLRGSDRPALPWTTRLQIALDSARGLEYIHEHTVPVYIHRDIKSPNILIDNNFRAKVADFGLTKLVQVGNAPLSTVLRGTFGYMPPEYTQFGTVSPKVDVFAFDVVLFELISGKDVVLKKKGSLFQPNTIVSLFEDVFTDSDPSSICQLVDPRLGQDYPLDSILKMAELARACTQENPDCRPIMRSVVVDLLSLKSASDDDLDIGGYYEHGLQSSQPCVWKVESTSKVSN
ncbi:hypothetical protein RND81_03G124800 [Saponaria officinalis]|uniref:non-specific serine/threonine protein kinase n=1 Tax=Saponaria officinalis TaxID=3572 RepID=A0AAW1M656_SAPOF